MKYAIKKLFLIVIHGSMGVGKTTLADLLHDEIENLAHFGIDHIKWLISDGKGDQAHPDRKKVSKQMVKTMAHEYLRLGTHVLVEQAFDKGEIDDLEKIAEEHNAHFLVYKLEADKHIMHERIKERSQKKDKPEVPQEYIDKRYEEYKNNEHTGGTVFNTGEITVREMADMILKDLE